MPQAFPHRRMWTIPVAALLAACGGGGDGAEPNRAPTATDQAVTTREDEQLGGTLDARDPEGRTLTVNIGRSPTLGRVSFENGATPRFTYIPDSNRNGSDSFTYTVSDGSLSSEVATVSITVTPVNDPPRFDRTPGNLSGEEDAILTDTVLMFDVDGDPLTLELATPPTQGTVTILDARAGRYSFTPPANLAGTFSFGLRVSDGSLRSDIATITASYTPVDDPPQLTITAPPQPLAPGTEVTLTCSATDIDSQAPTRFLWTSDGASPEFVRINDTQMRFVTPSFPAGATVSYRCFVSSSFASEQGSASVTLQVAPAADLDADGVADLVDDDDDNDGYADFYESLLGFNPRASTSRPDGVDPAARGVDFTADHDGDGFRTHHEIITRSDPLRAVSVPRDTDGDRIPDIVDTNGLPENLVPRVIAFATQTPTLDVTNGTARAEFTGTFADQTGVRRLRLFLRAIDETESDHALVIDTLASIGGVVGAGRILTVPISRHAPPGDWEVAGVIDSRDTVPNTGVTALGPAPQFPTRIRIENRNTIIDRIAPDVTGLSVIGAPVDPSLGGQRLRLQIQASDALSTISDVELAIAPPPSAVAFLWDEPLWIRLDPTQAPGTFVATSDVLPTRLAAGNWSIVQLRVRDNAGNAAVLGFDELVARGMPTEIRFANSGFDTQFPVLTGLRILTPTVDVSGGTGRIQMAVDFSDDRSGVARVEIGLFNSERNTTIAFEATVSPAVVAGTVTASSNVLASTTPTGLYEIDFIALTDGLGQRRQFSQAELVDQGIPIRVEVR